MAAVPDNPVNPLRTPFTGNFIERLPAWDDRARGLGLELEHLAPAIGTVVHGVDLGAALADPLRDFLYGLLVERKVICFREQDITPEQHIAFARAFGELEVHPFVPERPGYPEIIVLRNDAEHPPRGTALWHSDVTWRERPSLGSILLAREVPIVGGDTCWANMEAAYDDLDDELKAFLADKVAVHDSHGFRAALRQRGASAAEIEAFQKRYPPARHPVIRTHPDSGRKSIYVNAAFTLGIEGMEPAESAALLERLYATARRLEHQCRFRWRQGSVAFWDNRACQHYALADYWPGTRHMERVTIVGDRPC